MKSVSKAALALVSLSASLQALAAPFEVKEEAISCSVKTGSKFYIGLGVQNWSRPERDGIVASFSGNLQVPADQDQPGQVVTISTFVDRQGMFFGDVAALPHGMEMTNENLNLLMVAQRNSFRTPYATREFYGDLPTVFMSTIPLFANAQGQIGEITVECHAASRAALEKRQKELCRIAADCQ